MREIKFRAWDAINQMMLYPGFNPLDLKVWPTVGHVLMQYTGLKDKRSKEIYEGDIVKHRVGDKLIGMSQVVFGLHDVGPNSWGLEIKSLGFALKWEDGSGYAELVYGEDSEVIGNIYENPELLKEL